MRRTRHLTPLASLLVALCLAFTVAVPALAASLVPSVEVRAYTEGVGLRASVLDGGSSGGDGLGRPLQMLGLSLSDVDVPGTIAYSVHERGSWSSEASNGAVAGTRGANVYAVRMHLTGEVADAYDLAYRVSCVNIGWLGWTTDDAVAGAPGVSAVEAVQVRLVPKGGSLPTGDGPASVSAAGLQLSGYVDGKGWDGPRTSGNGVGEGGRALEGLKLSLTGENRVSGSVRYRVRVANRGWLDWVADGSDACPISPDAPIQTVQISLDGLVAKAYDICYRVYVPNFGWMGGAKNGAMAGTSGFELPVEAVQVWLVPKGADPVPASDWPAYVAAPELQFSGYVDGKGWDGPLTSGNGVGEEGRSLLGLTASLVGDQRLSGSISYRVYAGTTWRDWAENGSEACPVDANAPVQAVQMRLTGAVADHYDLWYRAFVPGCGWMGCAKDGASVGSVNQRKAMEAVQVWLLPKGSAAPESTENPFVDRFTSGDPELDGIVNTIIDRITGRGEDALRRAYDYVATYPYYYRDIYPTGDWSPGFAKQMYRDHGGNCYRYAALFREIARGLGYKARVVSGSVPTVSDPAAAHGWCEIELADGIYIFDPDMQHAYPTRNFYQRTYDHAPLTYSIIARGPW